MVRNVSEALCVQGGGNGVARTTSQSIRVVKHAWLLTSYF